MRHIHNERSAQYVQRAVHGIYQFGEQGKQIYGRGPGRTGRHNV